MEKRARTEVCDRSILVLYFDELGNAPHDHAYLIPASECTPGDHALLQTFDYCILSHADKEEGRKTVKMAADLATLLDVQPHGMLPPLAESDAGKRTFASYRLSQNRHLSGFLVERIYTIYGGY
jgi:hypothetical protein